MRVDPASLREGLRLRRHRRVRRRIRGTLERPRLVVHRSLRQIQGQIVDDVSGRVLLGISSLSREVQEALRSEGKPAGKIAISRIVGRLLAIRARERQITQVVFDRGGHLYHGRIKAFAEGAREGTGEGSGLIF